MTCQYCRTLTKTQIHAVQPFSCFLWFSFLFPQQWQITWAQQMYLELSQGIMEWFLSGYQMFLKIAINNKNQATKYMKINTSYLLIEILWEAIGKWCFQETQKYLHWPLSSCNQSRLAIQQNQCTGSLLAYRTSVLQGWVYHHHQCTYNPCLHFANQMQMVGQWFWFWWCNLAVKKNGNIGTIIF